MTRLACEFCAAITIECLLLLLPMPSSCLVQTVFAHIWPVQITGILHVSVADSPATDATSDSGPAHLPPAPKQSAQCSAMRGGPAGRRSHPGRKQMEAECIFKRKSHLHHNRNELIHGNHFHLKSFHVHCNFRCS